MAERPDTPVTPDSPNCAVCGIPYDSDEEAPQEGAAGNVGPRPHPHPPRAGAGPSGQSSSGAGALPACRVVLLQPIENLAARPLAADVGLAISTGASGSGQGRATAPVVHSPGIGRDSWCNACCRRIKSLLSEDPPAGPPSVQFDDRPDGEDGGDDDDDGDGDDDGSPKVDQPKSDKDK